jgi:protein CpxP
MGTSFRQTVVAATAIVGLSAFAAAAAPPAAGNPVTTHPIGTAPPSTSKDKPAAVPDMEGQIEARITDLHTRLQISPSQQPQWDQFTQVMRDNARNLDQTFQQRAQTLSAMTAAENMQSYAQVATEHATELQNLVPVFQALYQTMSASQKKTADQVFRADAHAASHSRPG